MSKPRQQSFYRLQQEQNGISRPAAVTLTPKDCANLKHQVSAFSNKVDGFLRTDEPSGDEDDDQKKKVKLGGMKSNPYLVHHRC